MNVNHWRLVNVVRPSTSVIHAMTGTRSRTSGKDARKVESNATGVAGKAIATSLNFPHCRRCLHGAKAVFLSDKHRHCLLGIAYSRTPSLRVGQNLIVRTAQGPIP